jgi:hypothetical protein
MGVMKTEKQNPTDRLILARLEKRKKREKKIKIKSKFAFSIRADFWGRK